MLDVAWQRDWAARRHLNRQCKHEDESSDDKLEAQAVVVGVASFAEKTYTQVLLK